MFGDALAALVGTQRNRPLSVAVAAGALFLPGSLIVFLARPALFFRLGLPTLLLLSAAISLPVIILCFSIAYGPLNVIRRAQRKLEDQAQASSDVAVLFGQDDPLEWPCLLAGAWMANIVLFVIAGVAYFRPMRIGATMLLVATILGAAWLIVTVLVSIGVAEDSRPTNDAHHAA